MQTSVVSIHTTQPFLANKDYSTGYVLCKSNTYSLHTNTKYLCNKEIVGHGSWNRKRDMNGRYDYDTTFLHPTVIITISLLVQKADTRIYMLFILVTTVLSIST